MNNANSPVTPTYEIHEDCGIDGNSGPHMVQTIDTGLTKREHFAAMAMQGFLSGGGQIPPADLLAGYAIEQANALLAALEADND